MFRKKCCNFLTSFLLLTFLPVPIFCIRRLIGEVCNPKSHPSECGKNAKCFVATPFCQYGRCACVSSRYQPLLNPTPENRGSCGLVLEEGDDCVGADPGVIPENAFCVQNTSVIVFPSYSVSVPVLFGESCNMTMEENVYGHCSMQRGLVCGHDNLCTCVDGFWPDAFDRSQCKPISIDHVCNDTFDCVAEYLTLDLVPRSTCDPVAKRCKCNTTDGFHPVSYYYYSPRDAMADQGMGGMRLQLGTWCYHGFVGRSNVNELCLRRLPNDKQDPEAFISPSMCRPELLCYSCPEDGGEDEMVGHCVEMPQEGLGFTAYPLPPPTTEEPKTEATIRSKVIITKTTTEASDFSTKTTATTMTATETSEPTLEPAESFAFNPDLLANALRTRFFEIDESKFETIPPSDLWTYSKSTNPSVSSTAVTRATTTTEHEQNNYEIDRHAIYEYGHVY